MEAALGRCSPHLHARPSAGLIRLWYVWVALAVRDLASVVSVVYPILRARGAQLARDPTSPGLGKGQSFVRVRKLAT